MSRLATPIHTATLNGKPLRFFRPPFDVPHMPWHVLDDLHVCLNMPQALRKQLQKISRQPELVGDVTTVATGGGIVTIGPDWMAKTQIDNVIAFGRTTLSFREEYEKASATAFNNLADAWLGQKSAGSKPTDYIKFCNAAFSNTYGTNRS